MHTNATNGHRIDWSGKYALSMLRVFCTPIMTKKAPHENKSTPSLIESARNKRGGEKQKQLPASIRVMKAPKSCRDKGEQHEPCNKECRIVEKIKPVTNKKSYDAATPKKETHQFHDKELDYDKFQIFPSCHSAAKIKHRLPARNPRTQNMATKRKNNSPQFRRTVNKLWFCRRLP